MSRVEIRWEADGQMRSQPALMEDISNSGMGLRVRTPFVMGAMVEIKFWNQVRRATVRHCRPEEQEYFIGVQFQKAAENMEEPTVRASSSALETR